MAAQQNEHWQDLNGHCGGAVEVRYVQPIDPQWQLPSYE